MRDLIRAASPRVRSLATRSSSFLLICASVLLAASVPRPARGAGESRPVADRLGVAHVDGKYHFTSKDFLNEGAEQIQALGSRVIKVWFRCDPAHAYPFNSHWPPVNSLVELARTPYFRELFDRPFTTFILETYAFGRVDHYWLRGITAAEAADEARQFEELTRYLLTTYAGSGKTFVFQNWEGDWGIRPTTDLKLVPTPAAIGGMIGWLNARQDGVDRARKATPARGVQAYHAAEVSAVFEAMEGKTSVTNDVLPHTHCDLYSYSAHETRDRPGSFLPALDYLASRAPDSPAFGARNIYIGEFGVLENTQGTASSVATVGRTIAEALDWGCPYFIYWEIYDNECRDGKCPGFWLIKPSGEKSALWSVLQSFLRPPARPPAYALGRDAPPPGPAPAPPPPGIVTREVLRPVFPAPLPGDPGSSMPPTPPPPPAPPTQPQPAANAGPTQVLALADGLINQVKAFIEAFAPTANVVPEGREFLADAQALGAAAAQFRQDAASGIDPARLSSGSRAIESLWLRLSRRTERIARGRTGPHIQQVGLMGQTVQQLRLACP